MENLSYVTRPLSGPASLGFLYETFPPLPARSWYVRVVPMYSRPPRSLSILQSTEALSSVYYFLQPFACRKWSRSWRSFLPPTLNHTRSLPGLVGVVRDLVGSRLGRLLTAKRETQDESSTAAIFLTCTPCFLSFLTLWKGHTVLDSASSMVVWSVCFSHSILPSRRSRCWVVPSLFGHNIFSSISVYFLGFASRSVYVLHPVSIQCRPGVLSLSFFHPFRLWMKAVVGEERGHLVCVGRRVIVGVFC